MDKGTCTNGSNAGDLTLEKILKAKKEYEDYCKKSEEERIFYYKTSKEILEVDTDGKPYFYFIGKDRILLFHPNNLPKIEESFKIGNLILKKIEEKWK